MCDLCWGGALEHGIMLKNGGEILPGVVTKCVKSTMILRASTTQPHNHTTHNNQHEPLRTLQRLRPSPSMGRPVAPPNHGAAAPYGPMHGARHRVCSRRPSIPCFGASKCNPSKNREGDGALALGGRRLITANNNQPKVGVRGGGDIGEGARL